MIIDLHAHYPMHLPESSETSPPTVPPSLGDVLRRNLLTLANLLANYPKDLRPAVTIEALKAGDVGIALSVLYLPFDELRIPLNEPPRAGYFDDLNALIDAVEADVHARPGADAVIAKNWAQVEQGLANRQTVLIHAIEGGFHLGPDPAAIDDRIARLKQRGVACITIAHLLYRQVATNAPALPGMPDEIYYRIFPQPDVGLTTIGVALIRAMVRHRVLIDLTHMSERAIGDTVRLLDEIDPRKTVPLIATHSGCRFNEVEYNLSEQSVRDIAARNGVIGLIVCKHWMSEGLKKPKTFQDSVGVVRRHVDRIHELTGSHAHTAIGSDLDGFIKPPLPGLGRPRDLNALLQRLREIYGAETARRIAWDNAVRVLQYWGVP